MSLDKLDVKEYPLALKPTPPELANLSYEIDEQDDGLYEKSFVASEEQVHYISDLVFWITFFCSETNHIPCSLLDSIPNPTLTSATISEMFEKTPRAETLIRQLVSRKETCNERSELLTRNWQ
jgi:hypothetical protein